MIRVSIEGKNASIRVKCMNVIMTPWEVIIQSPDDKLVQPNENNELAISKSEIQTIFIEQLNDDEE